MKLVSWNVNSLRSAEEKFLTFISAEQPDIIMVQELRANPNDLSFFLKFIPGYRAEFNPSGRPGYGGTAWYQKEGLGAKPILSSKTGVETLDREGRTIATDLGATTIFNFYTPNGNMSEERLKYKLKFHDAMKDLFNTLLKQKRSVIIGGDFNVAHTELDLYDPAGNRNHSGFLMAERKWFDDMLGLGLVDTFRMFQKSGGHYSWWHMRDPKRETNRGWRFDYFLVSRDLSKKVRRSVILKEVFGSDHCPILLEGDF